MENVCFLHFRMQWDNYLSMPLGVYISVPFCRTKCSYCNFASDVFSKAIFECYVDRVCSDVERAPAIAEEMGGQLERAVDSIYLGGGTPTVLEAAQLERLFATVRRQFNVQPDAEVTVECAPGTLTGPVLESLLRCGVNRVSLGVQSLVDKEAASVGRQHKRTTVLADIANLRAAGITNINIDLIAGLPHQTAESWEFSLAETIATSVPHVSVYMLEVDEDSRLGSELLAGGTRYHAHFVPDEGAIADFYLMAIERLQSSEIVQYEISNFARRGFESRHNLKYWTRRPYIGFGVDAHSMLKAEGRRFSTPADSVREQTFDPDDREIEAVRFAASDSLEKYMAVAIIERSLVSGRAALEEAFFLGLRLTRGISLQELAVQFGERALQPARAVIPDLIDKGSMIWQGEVIRLTNHGRLFSNEVFQRFLTQDGPACVEISS